MKRFITTATALVVLAAASGSAFAQPRHDDHRPPAMMMQSPHRDDHRGPGMAMRGPSHPTWRQGGKIARNDWNRGARVDYRKHHLRQPPRGYEWRQVDNNYVLAAVATGLIASILLANQ